MPQLQLQHLHHGEERLPAQVPQVDALGSPAKAGGVLHHLRRQGWTRQWGSIMYQQSVVQQNVVHETLMLQQHVLHEGCSWQDTRDAIETIK